MRQRFKVDGKVWQADLHSQNPLHVQILIDEEELNLIFEGYQEEGEGRLLLDDRYVSYFVTKAPGGTWVTLAGRTWYFEKAKKQGSADEAHGGFGAPMPGKVIKVLVAEGEAVTKGAVLVVMEAMKMEHRIEAPSDGTVTALHCTADQVVDQGFELLSFEAAES